MSTYPRSILAPALSPGNESGLLNQISPETACWEYLHAEVYSLPQEQSWQREFRNHEAILVILGGICSVRTRHNFWMRIGERQSVFDGFPFAVYLSQNSSVEITALSPSLEFFVGWCQVDEVFAERLITPDQVGVEIRGGGHATRQINSILPAGSACQRLVCVEVYTPGGNWSSYPPHKHDVHRVDPEGRLVEADLEEVYYYQIKPPQGFAIQRVYNEDRSLDQTVAAHHHDMVLIPEGYHPVSAAWGYDCYYLNLLAGSAQSLANQDDPAHTWVKEIWGRQDPRLPLV